MRKIMTAALLVGAIAWVGAVPTVYASQYAKKPAAVKAPASHSTVGTVKSLSSDTLVITRPGKKGGEVTFMVNSSTTKEGNPDVGSKVSVRFREEGKSKIATAIMVQPSVARKKR